MYVLTTSQNNKNRPPNNYQISHILRDVLQYIVYSYVSKNEYPKDLCFEEIGLRAPIMLTIFSMVKINNLFM
jgi:hypothetical protein